MYRLNRPAEGTNSGHVSPDLMTLLAPTNEGRQRINAFVTPPITSATDVIHSARLDILRVWACLAVILLHLSATLLSDQAHFGTIHWQVSNVIDAVTRWCVPLFVMISGALLLNPRKHNNLHAFWRKRVGRLLSAIVTWSAIYFAWRAYSWGEQISLGTVLHDLAVGLPFFHLYFLFIVGGLYMVTPWLAASIQALDFSQLRQLIFIVGAFVIGATLFDFAYGTLGTSVLTLFVPYLVYYLAGWYCLHLPTGNSIVYGLAVGAAIAVTTVMTYILVSVYGTEGRWSFYFYDYFSPTVMIATIGTFLFGLHGPIPTGIVRLARQLAPLTFGVYLAHPLVVELLRYAYVFFLPALLSPPYYVPITFLLTCVLTGGFVVLIRKTPGLRRIV